jgi:hypothetical protein
MRNLFTFLLKPLSKERRIGNSSHSVQMMNKLDQLEAHHEDEASNGAGVGD